MKKRRYSNYSVLLLLCLSAACSSVKVVNTESADGFRLSRYRTFDFYQVATSGNAVAADYGERLSGTKEEIKKQLESRGLKHATQNPDLLINLGVVVNEQVQTRQTDLRTDAPRYMGQRNYSWKSEEVETGRYREGTLALDLVDPKENQLVWKGAVEGVIPEKEQKRQTQAAQGIKELISRIPE